MTNHQKGITFNKDCPHGNCLGCDCPCHEPERKLANLKAKIKHHIEVRAGETVFAVWRRELLEMIK